ncbi:MAG: hypothetical protein JJU45_07355, partial [Acidimicrobiia bacterium]|nr:hypothetical protein [Acidimicrobiia bacterium]
MRRTLTAVTLSLALVVAGGCASDDAGDETGEEANEEASEFDDIVGRYAHFDVVAYEDELMKTLIISYGFADLAEVDGELQWAPEFCFSEHRSDQPISVEFSDEATSAIRPVPAVVTVSRDEDGTVHLSRPTTPTGIGVRLDDPANDPLPTDPAAPRGGAAAGGGPPPLPGPRVGSPPAAG